jgi:integrase
MFKWAAAEKPDVLTPALVAQNPAAVTLRKPARPGGHQAWKEHNAQAYEGTHVLGTKARLTSDLLFFTGARISDVVRMGPLNIVGGKLCWTEWKGRNRHEAKEHKLPILTPLQASLDAYAAARGNVTSATFLTTRTGAAYSEHSLGEALRAWCKEAGVPAGLSAHGCRKLAAIRCAHNGASIKAMMSVFGWRTEKQALYYIEQAEKELFEEAGAPALMPRVA